MTQRSARARVVLVTAPDPAVARAIARAWVDERLVACVNLVPGVTSVYRWEDRVEESSEVLMIAKTSAERVPALEASLSKLHPYDVPEFVVLAAQHVAPAYARWLADETA